MSRCATRFHQLGKAVIGVVMIDGGRRDEFVFYKNRGRNLPLVQDVKTDSNQVVAVTLREVGDRSDQPSVGLAEFGAALRRCILPHDGAIFRASCFLKRAQGTEGAGIIDGTDQNAAIVGGSQVTTNRLKTWS